MPTALDDVPALKPAGASRPRRVRRNRRGIALPYLLLLPAILLELLVHVIPMIAGLVMSFFKLTQFSIRDFSSAPAAGLDNYKFVLDFDSAAGKALLGSFWISVLYTVLSVGFCWLFGTSAAVLMQKNFRGRGLLRTLFLVPYALPMYAAVITWSFMFQKETGLVNDLLGTDSFWLIGDNSFWSLVVVSVWRNWPFAFLIVMAGLQNIPGELYEAAAIDGAGWWRQFQAITQPMLRPVNQVLLLVLFLWTFNDFNTPYVLFGASAPKEASLISIHIYQSSFVTWNFGLGSAMSVLLLLFLLLVSTVYLGLTARRRKAVV
ncbi:carbohydrate ABC transporter membrane protein 1, CUT1 family [Amycolatopsis lurida]|uniref:ABC transporter permease n=1 Tax=Amycolatopsis lurida NRRL 2430 TaxID=1460371 RepID=A0A2P2FKQ6_AMYLU|nr:sugar ABC transporter permease [Amycolatopsis lurida]KFU77307.1 ABC transporter permease [Amycolatopsis lurida NRRL 2430]SEB35691.1 carbohydrate ABC transporter membrane protein 1, CUT1 family [Amycolatopsis lurida]